MSATTEAEQAVVAEVLAAEEARLAAIDAQDWAAAAEYLAEDVVYVHMNAKLEGKEGNLAELKEAPRHYSHSELVVQPYGDFAVMTGVLDVAFPPNPDGTSRGARGRAIQVWARQDGRWVMVAFQATAIPAA
jgi:ketosteroid isomerase-like protein